MNDQEIFFNDEDRAIFVDDLKRFADDLNISILAYCLMGNHFHLAAKVGVVPLSSMMQRLLTAHSSRFNRRHDRRGHLFQARYEAKLCASEDYLRTLIRYIHYNPVKDGFVEKASDWPWSSAAGLKDDGVDPQEFDPWAKDEQKTPQLMRNATIERTSLEVVAAGLGASADELKKRTRKRQFLKRRADFVRGAVSRGYLLQEIADWLNVSPMSVTRYSRMK